MLYGYVFMLLSNDVHHTPITEIFQASLTCRVETPIDHQHPRVFHLTHDALSQLLSRLLYNFEMQINEIVAALDSEILRLQQVKALLSGSTTNGKKHHLSAEARARIAAAQKKRWAKAKRASK